MLWLAGLAMSFAFAASQWVAILLAIVGLVVGWEIAGRHASIYSEILHTGQRESTGRRTLSFLASALASIAYFSLAVGLIGEAFPTARVTMLVVAATVLGGWLVLGVFRQWWRVPYAVAGVGMASAVGVYAIASAADLPEPAATIGVVFVRLAVVWLWTVGILAFSGRRRSRSLRDSAWLRMLWLAPAQIASIAFVLRPPGTLTHEMYDSELWFFAMGVQIVVAVLLLVSRAVPVVRDSVVALRMTREKGDARGLLTGLFVSLVMLPAVAASAVAGWTQWAVVVVMSTIASAAIVRLGRPFGGGGLANSRNSEQETTRLVTSTPKSPVNDVPIVLTLA